MICVLQTTNRADEETRFPHLGDTITAHATIDDACDYLRLQMGGWVATELARLGQNFRKSTSQAEAASLMSEIMCSKGHQERVALWGKLLRNRTGKARLKKYGWQLKQLSVQGEGEQEQPDSGGSSLTPSDAKTG